MALRYLDPFGESYETADLVDRWNVVNAIGAAVGAAGRCPGSEALSLNMNITSEVISGNNYFGNGLVKVLDAQDTWIVGFAYKTNNISSSHSALLAFGAVDAGGNTQPQSTLFLLGNGRLQVRRKNNVVLGTSNFALKSKNWYYIEIKIFFNDITGAVDIQVNGNNVLSILGTIPSPIDTQAFAIGFPDTIRIGGAINTGGNPDDLWDDLYIADTQTSFGDFGGRLIDFAGDCAVSVIMPDGNGASQDFTPAGTGSAHWDRIEEKPPDDDTSYLESSTLNHEEFQTYEDIDTGLTVIGIQVIAYVKKTEAGVRAFLLGAREGGVNRYGQLSHFPSVNDYIYFEQPMDKNAATTNQWTAAEVNSNEFGIKVDL